MCWHVTVGGAAGSISWLCNPDSGASSNYLIDRAGTIYELVPPNESAWANGAVNHPDLSNPVVANWVYLPVNPNTRTISVEHERLESANEQPGGFTEAQHQSTVALGAWLCQEYPAIVPDRQHIIGHRSIDSVNREHCPGLAESEWDQWVGEIAALVAGERGAVQEPKAGVALGYINAKGEAVYVWNAGGHAVAVEGADAQDVGLTVRNDQGERYSVSLQKNVQQPWVKVG